jgi:hypothetical protein
MAKSTVLIDKAQSKTTTISPVIQVREVVAETEKQQDSDCEEQVAHNRVTSKKTFTVSVTCNIRGRRKPVQYPFDEE